MCAVRITWWTDLRDIANKVPSQTSTLPCAITGFSSYKQNTEQAIRKGTQQYYNALLTHSTTSSSTKNSNIFRVFFSRFEFLFFFPCKRGFHEKWKHGVVVHLEREGENNHFSPRLFHPLKRWWQVYDRSPFHGTWLSLCYQKRSTSGPGTWQIILSINSDGVLEIYNQKVTEG